MATISGLSTLSHASSANFRVAFASDEQIRSSSRVALTQLSYSRRLFSARRSGERRYNVLHSDHRQDGAQAMRDAPIGQNWMSIRLQERAVHECVKVDGKGYQLLECRDTWEVLDGSSLLQVGDSSIPCFGDESQMASDSWPLLREYLVDFVDPVFVAFEPVFLREDMCCGYLLDRSALRQAPYARY
jgi:hypothetical protein